jgi:hypothetical protein
MRTLSKPVPWFWVSEGLLLMSFKSPANQSWFYIWNHSQQDRLS